MGEASFIAAGDALAHVAGIRGVEEGATLMLRPDDVTFTQSPGGTAVVTAAEFRGSSWCYTMELAPGVSIRSTRSHLDHIAVGAAVTAEIRPGHRPVVLHDE